MTSSKSLPSREDVLAHGVPVEIIDRLREEARAARARAIVAAARAGIEALSRALRDAWSHSLSLKTKAL